MEDPVFFNNKEELRKWFKDNHNRETELWLGYYKKGTENENYSWSQTVDVALCFGWIDGIRKSVDEKSYKIRFTPRNPKSHWSKVNIEKMENLIKSGLIEEPGLKAYKNRKESNSKQFSYEKRDVTLPAEYLEKIKANKKAWEFYNSSLAPSYKKASVHWITSAKQETTRLKRLNILIESCEQGRKIPPLRKNNE